MLIADSKINTSTSILHPGASVPQRQSFAAAVLHRPCARGGAPECAGVRAEGMNGGEHAHAACSPSAQRV